MKNRLENENIQKKDKKNRNKKTKADKFINKFVSPKSNSKENNNNKQDKLDKYITKKITDDNNNKNDKNNIHNYKFQLNNIEINNKKEKDNNFKLKISPDIENKYISFNQNDFIEPIYEENGNRNDCLLNCKYNHFTLIPNKELYTICGTNSDINDINEGILKKKKLNKYLTYPYDESNTFIAMKQSKEKTKNSLMKKIEELLINKKNLNNKKQNKNFVEIKNNKGKEPKPINKYNNFINNYNNYKYHSIDKSNKNDNKKGNNYKFPISNFNEGEIVHNNRKYKIEKIYTPSQSNQKKTKNNINENKDNNIIIYSKNKNNNNSIKNNIERKNDNFELKDKENNKNNDNMLFVNYIDEKIEQIRENLNSINVIDTLSEQAGLQCYKGPNNYDDELYFKKAKEFNKEFYDNLDIKFCKIEEFLDLLENK